MSIYLGDSGAIELERDSLNIPLHSLLDPDDVNVARRRFSFDFPTSSLITGDKLEIATLDGSTLELVDGHVYPDGHWFIHVDPAGGVRLYDDFADALTGGFDNALPLIAPSAPQAITAKTSDSEFRCIGQVREYSFTSSRETLDLTGLGEEFRRSYADGLITGQGTLTCFWDYKHELCGGLDIDSEVPNYLAQLVIRTQLGSDFVGRFYLKRPELNSEGKYLWYEARCIITNCSLQFAVGQPVFSTVEFVATEQFTLRMGTPPSYLLQEDGNKILQEDRGGILLDSD